jgi:hypothetical protein
MKTIIKLIPIYRQSLGITILILFVGLSSCKKNDTTIMSTTSSYSGNFVKSTATVVTSGTGTVTATFDKTTSVLTYTINWSGLGSNVAAMHFHDAGPVIYPITGFPAATSGSVSGTVTFTTAQAADLAAGKIYAQIHTTSIPSGEILAYFSLVNTTTTGGSVGGYGY